MFQDGQWRHSEPAGAWEGALLTPKLNAEDKASAPQSTPLILQSNPEIEKKYLQYKELESGIYKEL